MDRSTAPPSRPADPALVGDAGGVDAFDGPALRVRVAGTLRDGGGDRLTARSLVERGLLGPGGLDGDRVTGDGVVVWSDPEGRRAGAYATLLAVPRLYFAVEDRRLRLGFDFPALVAELGPAEPTAEAVIDTFAFRFVLPPATIHPRIRQLPPGHGLRYDDGRVILRRESRLPDSPPHFRTLDPAGVADLDRAGRERVEAAARHGGTDGRAATLFSGGVDSVLLAAWLRDAGQTAAVTFTVPDAPSFTPETRRARVAAARLGLRTSEVAVPAARYAELLDHTVAHLGRPALFNEAWPCQHAVGEARTRGRAPVPATLLAGNAADGLHGGPILERLARRAALRRVPGALALLRGLRPLLERVARSRGIGSRLDDLAELAALGGPGHPLRGPTARVALAAELELLVACFGPRAVADAFERRLALASPPAGSSEAERVQAVDLTVTGCEPSTALAELYRAAGIRLELPYRDEAVVRAVHAFDPAVRYASFAGRRSTPKPLQAALADLRGVADLARAPKGGTTFYPDLRRWMRDGPLWDHVRDMERPAFVPAAVFRAQQRRPGDFAWNLLVWDAWRRTG